ncbi:glycosyltransferase [Candidatus Dojkabacteria bacterium]|nr:glycosyltransferase [Candidatus Dojkabacteria bacterium]
MNKTSNPKISIVIPAFNEEGYIDECLESILNQDFDQDYEVIVVNNTSTDNTEKIVREYKNVILVEEQIKGIAQARQTGFMAAKSDIIVSTDADVIVPRTWLSSIWNLMLDNKDAVAIGGYWILYGNPIFEFIYKKAADLDILTKLTKIYSGQPLSTANLAVRKWAWEKVGGFDTEIKTASGMDDIDITLKLSKIGRVIASNDFIVRASARRYIKKPWTIPLRLINALSFSLFGRGIWRKGNSDVR